VAADRAAHRRRHDIFLRGTIAKPLRDDEVSLYPAICG
jgi:hypothetical protein